jgi:uncharacterized protein YggE
MLDARHGTRTIAAIVACLAVGWCGHVAADPERRGSITVTGTASAEVHPDRLVLGLELSTARRSFAEARDAARAMAASLAAIEVPAEGVSIAVDYDLSFLRQRSWGRGRSLEHHYRIVVDGVPDGEAQDLLVHLVDRALALHADLTVIHSAAELSPERRRATHVRLMQAATADARAKADGTAASAGLRILDTVSIAEDGTSSFLSLSSGIQAMEVVPGRFFQQPFAVHSSIPSRIPYRVGVVVQFAAAPEE